MRNVRFGKWVRSLLVLGVALAAAALLVVLKPEAERTAPGDEGRLVEVLTAEAQSVDMRVKAYGTVSPRAELHVVAEVKGQIVALHPAFVEGGVVPAGAVFITIDPRSYELEVERRRVQIRQTDAELKRLTQEVANLRASRRIAQTDVTLSEKDMERIRHLFDKNVLSQSSLDKAEQKLLASLERLQGIDNQLELTGPMQSQLNAQKDMAQVALKQALLDLEKTRLIAPYDASVLAKSVEIGQTVAAGQVMGRIYNADQLDVEVQIPLKEAKWLPADIGDIEVTVAPQNESLGLQRRARLARVKAQIEENTRMLPLVIEIDAGGPSGGEAGILALKPGMFVAVTIKGRPIAGAFLLPRHVVYPGNVVYIVENERLKARAVGVLRTYQESVVVDKGLTSGERIVRTPLPSAVDGMKVRVIAEP